MIHFVVKLLLVQLYIYYIHVHEVVGDVTACFVHVFSQSFGLADRARQSRIRSEDLAADADAEKLFITTELRPRLDSGLAAVTALEQLNDDVSDGLQELNDGLDMLPVGKLLLLLLLLLL